MKRGGAVLAIALLFTLPLGAADASAADANAADATEAWIEAMPIEARLAQLLFVSFDGRAPRGELRRFGGVIFYRGNIRSSSHLRAMTSDLSEGSNLAPFLAVDQEGGEVTRITEDVPLLPGNMALGATQSPQLAWRAGRALGGDLRRLGITMNFGPVVDRAANEQSSIGIRSFGSEPQLVGALGAAIMRGQRAGGVASVAKHFPGIGSAAVDSHDALIVFDELNPDDLAPFRAVIDAGVEAVMLGHVVVPSLDARLFSPKLIALLREDLGFDGIVITDALEMGAVDHRNGIGNLTVDAIANGADMVMLHDGLSDGDVALAALTEAYRSGRLSEARLRRSLRRILRVKLALPALNAAPPDRNVADAIADRSVTVLRNDGVLPLSDVSLYIGPAGPIANAASAAHSLHPPVRFKAGELERWSAAAAATRDATLIVAAAQNRSQMQVIRAAHEANPRARIVLVSLGSPYLIRDLPDVDAYVCVYGYLAPSQRAAARALRMHKDARISGKETRAAATANSW